MMIKENEKLVYYSAINDYINKIRTKSLRNVTYLFCLLAQNGLLTKLDFRELQLFIKKQAGLSLRASYDYCQGIFTMKTELGL